MKPTESLSSSFDADQTHLAERELSAFFTAVTELFGPDQARLSSEDWLEESEFLDSPRRSGVHSWRVVTIAASTRLAKRVSATITHEFSPHINN